MNLRPCNKAFVLLAAFAVLLLGQPCLAGQIKAFSLREADRLLATEPADNNELQGMAGISRFAGMVFDRKTQDIILVGKVRDDLPGVRIDDLIVALRSRLQKKDYPRVSIDRVQHTEKTGMQEVRFDGGIEDTEFGTDFLNSDIMLKRYSLGLLDEVGGISPYLKLYDTATRERLRQQGQAVDEVRWLSEKDSTKVVEQNKGSAVSEHSMVQSRFWFHVRAEQSFIVEKDDVFVIEELSLGVRAETLPAGAQPSGKKEEQKDDVAEEFARLFTESFWTASEAHPVLQRLKALFDLVAIAEGIAHLADDRPDLAYLVEKQSVRRKLTPDTYRLVERVGEFRSGDETAALVQLSGGIELEAILLALEDGDVSALKMAVLASRPSSEALSWTVPIDTWEMPNDFPPQGHSLNGDTPASDAKPNDLGFGISVQRFAFNRGAPKNDQPIFTGFTAAPAMPLRRRPPAEPRNLDRMLPSRQRMMRSVRHSLAFERIAALHSSAFPRHEFTWQVIPGLSWQPFAHPHPVPVISAHMATRLPPGGILFSPEVEVIIGGGGAREIAEHITEALGGNDEVATGVVIDGQKMNGVRVPGSRQLFEISGVYFPFTPHFNDVPAQVQPFYLSGHTGDTGFGKGWSFAPFAIEVNDGQGASPPRIITVVDFGNGVRLPYRRSAEAADNDMSSYEKVTSPLQPDLRYLGDQGYRLQCEDGRELAFDAAGRLTTTTNNGIQLARYVYVKGRLQAIEAERGLCSFQHAADEVRFSSGDVDGQFSLHQGRIATFPGQRQPCECSYGPNGWLTSVKCDRRALFENEYDKEGRLLAHETQGQRLLYGYEHRTGRLVVKASDGRSRTFFYDHRQRLTACGEQPDEMLLLNYDETGWLFQVAEAKLLETTRASTHPRFRVTRILLPKD